MTSHTLEEIYDQTVASRTDFLLLEDVTNFDWDYFWKMYIITDQNIQQLEEEFLLVKDAKEYDQYAVTASGGPKFELWVNFISKENTSNRIQGSLASNLKDGKILAEIQKRVDETDYPVLNVNFKDSENNIHLTGKVGNYTTTIIRSVKKAIVSSLYRRSEGAPDVLFFLILKSEGRKLEFFKKAYALMFAKLVHQYTDTSDPVYDLVYFWS